MNELTERTNIPLEAVIGGPQTMYPEYRKTLKDKYTPPPPAAPAGRGRGAGAGAAPPAGGRGGQGGQ
jgi:hypothetical protein